MDTIFELIFLSENRIVADIITISQEKHHEQGSELDERFRSGV